MSLFLTAIIESKPGQALELKDLLHGLVSQSRQETACLQYDLHQSATDENIFIFHEKWADEAGFAAHNAQPYILDFVEKLKVLATGPAVIHVTQRLA
jgi:quinol monooxygenase YgiN